MGFTLGIAPVKRSFLSMEVAKRHKEEIVERVRGLSPNGIEIVTIDDVCENGIAYKADDAAKVIGIMTDKRIDALFLPFCDFGEETVAAEIAAALRVPTLVWGPRDEYPNTFEARGRDTQCGMFAATKVLARRGVKYSYIVSCKTSSDGFANGFTNFLRAVNAVKTVRGLRVLKIGDRPAPFMSVMADEGALLEKFGIVCVPASASAIAEDAERIMTSESALLSDCVRDYAAEVDLTQMPVSDVRRIFAIKLAIAKAMRKNGCRACATACWNASKEFGVTPCAAMGELAGENLPVSCEGDVAGAVTMALLSACSLNDAPVFFADLTIRHPNNDNAELLWHCGPFPRALKAADSYAKMIDDNGCWRLKDGDITIARLDDINGAFRLFAGEGHTTEGPETTGTYAWFEVDCWKKWEETLMFGPYIHHVGGVYGKYAIALREAARYLDIAFDAPGDGGVRAL